MYKRLVVLVFQMKNNLYSINNLRAHLLKHSSIIRICFSINIRMLKTVLY